MDRIIEFFKSYTLVSNKSWDYFSKYLELHHYSNGEIIHHAHQPCCKLHFILQGFARSYFQKPDGKDFTWFFHYFDDNCSAKQFILVDYPSFNLHSPSTYGFQSLSQCQVASISYSNLVDVFQCFPEFLTIEKHMLVSAYQHNNERLQSLLTKSAKERLEEFTQAHGSLFSHIPHYHIASYLGITPQRLSQLRRS